MIQNNRRLGVGVETQSLYPSPQNSRSSPTKAIAPGFWLFSQSNENLIVCIVVTEIVAACKIFPTQTTVANFSQLVFRSSVRRCSGTHRLAAKKVISIYCLCTSMLGTHHSIQYNHKTINATSLHVLPVFFVLVGCVISNYRSDHWGRSL
jgi:hypothetical protein